MALDAAGQRDGRAPDEPGGYVPDDQTTRKTVGLGEANSHTFRATGITAYLLNAPRSSAPRPSPRMKTRAPTKLYDRTDDEMTIEKIGI